MVNHSELTNDMIKFAVPIDMKTTGKTPVALYSHDRPLLMVFLRHFGCVFCKEALIELSQMQEDLKKKGIEIMFVHMADQETAEPFFKKYGFSDVQHVSDPECRWYSEFGLTKGNFNQLFGLKNFIRGVETTFKGIMPSIKQIGDGFQMPGIFMIRNGNVVDQFIHRVASDRPDYKDIISCCAA